MKSGDVNKNGEYGENDKFGENSPTMWRTSDEKLKGGPSIIEILTKIATFQGASLNMSLEFSLNLWRIFAKFAIFVVTCISGHI